MIDALQDDSWAIREQAASTLGKLRDRRADHPPAEIVCPLRSGDALAEEKQRCLESGMDSCLSKPVTLDVLKTTLALYAERVRKSREG